MICQKRQAATSRKTIFKVQQDRLKIQNFCNNLQSQSSLATSNSMPESKKFLLSLEVLGRLNSCAASSKSLRQVSRQAECPAVLTNTSTRLAATAVPLRLELGHELVR